MAASSGTGKVCVKCGVDCSNKPRTKDSQGRYYCQPCYEAAVQKRSSQPSLQARPQPKPAIKSSASRSGASPDLLLSHDAEDGPINLLDKLIASAPPPVTATPCPSCGMAMQGGAVICTSCGFNSQTNHAIRAPKVYKAPREATGGVIWPPLVGIVSIVFGGAGLLLYGAGLLMAAIAGLSSGNILGAIIAMAGPLLLTSLAAWLLRDGIRILRRDSSGVTWIRGWAVIKLLIISSCFGVIMMVPNESLARTRAGQSSQIDVVALKAMIGVYWAFFAFWPAFILTFFFIPRIMRDVKAWN